MLKKRIAERHQVQDDSEEEPGDEDENKGEDRAGEEGDEDEDEAARHHDRAQDSHEKEVEDTRFQMDLSDDEVDGANNDIPTLDDSPSAPKDTKKGKTVGVDERALARFNEDMQKRGVVYLSRIPPFMKPLKIRQYFSQFGKIDRVYLTPEATNPTATCHFSHACRTLAQDERVRLKRKRMGGNKRQKFIDGWVEFCDKKIAKRVALNLNGEPIGGAKSNYWRPLLCPHCGVAMHVMSCALAW